jgi:hypothetical protein
VEVLAPAGCGGCGRDLSGVSGRGASRVQVFDTPPVKLQVTEYQLLAAGCPGCGQTTRAAAPAGGGRAVLLRTERARGHGAVGLQRAHEHRTRRRPDGGAAGRPSVTWFAGGLIARVAERLVGFEQALKGPAAGRAGHD